METQTIRLNGKSYVILERKDYDRLTSNAKTAELPPLPAPDANGNYPAVEYARASLARSIIQDRVKAGVSQAELAKLAGIRLVTLDHIESGKHTPSASSIKRIDRALERLLRKKKKA